MKPKGHHSRATYRYVATLITIFGAATAAVAIVHFFAIGIRSGGFQPLSNLGEARVIRMPVDARRIEDVKSFVIKMGGADDYGRVFANNYLVLNKEAPSLFSSSDGLAVNRNAVESRKARRNAQLPPENDVKGYLRRGANFIVAELENATGPCVFAVDIVVNGTPLEGFPTIVPDQFDADKESVNATLFQKFRKAEQDNATEGVFAPDPYDDLVCGRRIFQVDLD